MEPIIELKEVKKSYALEKTRVEALRGVTFSVQKGEFMSIVGPSGSGKTTLLNLIGCLDTPSEGDIWVDGQKINALNDKALTSLRLYKIGFIFQTFNLIPVLDVLENVEFPLLMMNRYSKQECKAKAEALIEAVGIGPYIKHRPAELSGGQRQRVAIARALVTEPAIVLADEPTANLDSKTGADILNIMQRMNETQKTTFIFSTHDPDVLSYAKRIVKIKDGTVVE